VEVMTTRAKRVSAYNRLLLSMSIFDTLSSIGHMLGPLPMPVEFDDEVAWAKGNDLTCDVQGFLVQLGIVAPVYHVFLSIYYLLLVRFGITQDKIINYAEPIMHSTAILIGVGTGIASIAMDLFSNATLWCWIVPFPTYYRVVFFYAPLWISMILVLGLNIWIYFTVQKGERKAEKLHAIHHQKHGRWHFGEQNRGNNLTSVVVPEGKKMQRWSIMSLMSFSSHSSSKRLDSQRSRVSFTFGQPPSRIVSTVDDSQEKQNREVGTSLRGLHAIDEAIASDQFSAGESIRTAESNRADQKKPDSVSELSSQKKDAQQPRNDAMKKSTSFAYRFKEIFTAQKDDDEDPEVSTSKRGDQGRSRSLPELPPLESEERESIRSAMAKPTGIGFRLKEMFMPESENEPSFMFAKDHIEPIPSGESENIFHDSINSIQRIILPERSARRFSRKIQRRQSSAEFQSMNSLRSVDVKFVLATVEDYPSAARQYAATYHIGARLILFQSIAFVVGFWMIWIFPTARQLVLLEDPRDTYGLLVLQAIFEPLQGFFNFSVYRFSHFIRLRELHPEWTMRKLLYHTMRWSFLTKRSNFAKAERESEARSSIFKGSFVQSVLSNQDGERQSDSDSDSGQNESGLIEAPKGTAIEMPKEKQTKRMSSLMGDLMTEFADFPDTLNEEYKEVVGHGLFTYPTSTFPTIYSRQSFSGIPRNSKIPFPMPHFPAGQKSIYCDDIFDDQNRSLTSLREETQTPSGQIGPLKENSDSAEVDRSTKDITQTEPSKENSDSMEQTDQSGKDDTQQQTLFVKVMHREEGWITADEC